MSWLSRLNDKFTVGDGCWQWTAGVGKAGYGIFWLEGKSVLAHRVVYQIFEGPIPDGLQLDHLCRNRLCVRPDHLEPVSARTNTLRSEANSAVNARKSECHRGHPLLGANLYVNPRGERQCRECQRAAGRRYEQRRMANARS